MNGLRVFIRSGQKGQVNHNTFYSQRGHGPVYRWHYEEHLARWEVVRLHASEWSSHEFCTARWQSVPQKLKSRLSEHYVE